MCAAGMALLVIEFINVYSTAKPKQTKNCPLGKEKGTLTLFLQSIVERPMEERLGGSRYPNPGELSPSSGKLAGRFFCVDWLLLLLLYALMKSIYFSSVSWVPYYILVARFYRLTKPLFYWKILQITLAVRLMILCLYFLLCFRLPQLVESCAFSSQAAYKCVLVLTVWNTKLYNAGSFILLPWSSVA